MTTEHLQRKARRQATEYIAYGLALKDGQKQTLAKAARDGVGATIRLGVDQLQGEDQLGLTNRQISHIIRKKEQGAGAELKFSKTQLQKLIKMGGVLPLLSLIPLILGGVSAAGALAGGAAGVAKAVQDKQANTAAQAETERHNREVEAQLRGSGLYLAPSAREIRGGCCPMCNGSGLFLSTALGGQKN